MSGIGACRAALARVKTEIDLQTARSHEFTPIQARFCHSMNALSWMIRCAALARWVWVLALPAGKVIGAEVRFIAVTKGSLWEQTDTGAPGQKTGNAFTFRAHEELVRLNALTAATLKWPSLVNLTRPLVNNGLVWELSEAFGSRNLLNAADPNGTYTFVTESAADGRRTNTVTLSADIYPNPLRVANFVECQTIDSQQNFTVRWDPAGSGGNGFTQLRVFEDNQLVFQSPSYPQASGALNGSASSMVIPGKTLAEGKAYRGELTIWRKVTDDVTGYPGVSAWAAYTQTTEFALRTRFAVTDVFWYGYAKIQNFGQTSANAPVPNGTFAFRAFTDATAAANIKGASLGSKALINQSGTWRFNEDFPSQQALDAQYPNGALAFSIQTEHNGVRNLSLNLPAGAFPAAPRLSNFNDANAIQAGQAFTLRWDPLAGGAASDFVQVMVRKGGTTILRSGDHPYATGALNGVSTSFGLPANLLASGEACDVTLFFLKASALDPYSYPNALGVSGFARQTTATIRARGGVVTTPRIDKLRRIPGAVEFEFDADAGRQYIVEQSSDFSIWNNLIVTNAPGARFLLRLPLEGQTHHRWMRVVAY